MNDPQEDIKVIHVPHQRMVYEVLEKTAREWGEHLDHGYRNFVIDMGEVSFMDSASIGCLMDFYRKTKAAGGRIHLAAVQPRIETLLAIAKAKRLFPIYKTVEEARTGFETEGSDL